MIGSASSYFIGLKLRAMRRARSCILYKHSVPFTGLRKVARVSVASQSIVQGSIWSTTYQNFNLKVQKFCFGLLVLWRFWEGQYEQHFTAFKSGKGQQFSLTRQLCCTLTIKAVMCYINSFVRSRGGQKVWKWFQGHIWDENFVILKSEPIWVTWEVFGK